MHIVQNPESSAPAQLPQQQPPPPAVPPAAAPLPELLQHLSLPTLTAESFFMIQFHRYAQVHVAPKLAARLFARKNLQNAPYETSREFSVNPVMSEWFYAFCRSNRFQFGFVNSKNVVCHAGREFLSAILAPSWMDDAVFIDHTDPADCLQDPDNNLPCLHQKRLQILSAAVHLHLPQEILTVTLQVRQLDVFGEEMLKK